VRRRRNGRLSGDSHEREAKEIIRSASFKLGQLCETTRDKHECFDVIGPAMAKAEIRIARVMKKL
jgi:hypothetical protein